MGDPISVGGFAIGAVSLGIQICQGLVSYYSAYKSSDEDIDRIINKLRGLENTLKNLKKGITKFRNANAQEVKDVNEKILSCDEGIHNLQKILQKFRSSSHSVQRTAQKTLYPFRKATLHELDVSLNDLQRNLNTGLLSLLM